MRISWASVLLPLALGCTPSSDQAPSGDLVQKAGSSTTASGCLAGMVGALALAVRDLHFRGNCIKNSETGQFSWTYIHKDQVYTGDEKDTVEKCIDNLATHLNDHVPFLEISLTERCGKRVKMFNGEKLVWAFDYRGGS